MPCEIKRLAPITVSVASIFNIEDKETTVLFELRNPNVNYGADHISYFLDLFDGAGATTTSIAGSTFIYPGEIKILLHPGIQVAPWRVTRATLRIGDTSWKSAEIFRSPSLQLREMSVTADTSHARAVVTGMVSNKSLLILSHLTVDIVIVDAAGEKIAASKTVLENLGVDETRSFQVTVPGGNSPSIIPDQVKVFFEALPD